MRKHRPLRGRVTRAEITGGHLVLSGAWNEWDVRTVEIAIHADDVPLVEQALAEFKAGNESFTQDRETQKQRLVREKAERAVKRAAAARRKAERTFGGVKLIGD